MRLSEFIARLADILAKEGDAEIKTLFQYYNEDGIMEDIETDITFTIRPINGEYITSSYVLGTRWKLIKQD